MMSLMVTYPWTSACGASVLDARSTNSGLVTDTMAVE